MYMYVFAELRLQQLVQFSSCTDYRM